MIITRLKGGLGNQMFQYAAGLSLSKHLQTSLKVDGSFLYETAGEESITQRKFELSCFGIKDDSIDSSGFRRLRKVLLSRPYQFFQHQIPSLLPWGYILEKDFAYNSAFFDYDGNLMIDGYWQSEKYFLSIEKDVRNTFTLTSGLSAETISLQNYLRNELTVSVHIRRGDLITNPTASAMHGVCSDAYYIAALDVIRSKFPNIKVIMFSDDPVYVKNNMQFLKPEVTVDWNDDKVWEDIHLMHHCSHHVIANSSFSWWGAWLNPDKEKTVIAPQQWFASGHLNTATLVPEKWIRI